MIYFAISLTGCCFICYTCTHYLPHSWGRLSCF